MASTIIDTIVFDLGGVLIDWNPLYLYKKIFSTEEEAVRFLEEVCNSAWNVQQDGGRSLAEATEERVRLHPEREAEIRAYYERWPEMLGGIIPGTVELLDTLAGSGQYRLYALTNWSAETFPIALGRYAFFQHFQGILVSGAEKLIKPDPRIYQLLCSRYDILPEKAVFIDDSPKNVVGARNIGMHAIHFQSPMQLREELAELLT